MFVSVIRNCLLIAVLTLSILIVNSCENVEKEKAALDLNSGWKFIAADNLDFALPEFNDSDWTNIKVDKPWEKQGFDKYDGFAWYRIKVVIPSSLKNNSDLKDSLILNLGKIDDFNQFFLNGELAGENLKNVNGNTEPDDKFKDSGESDWDINRRYSLAADNKLIKWDKENVIAVRVYDWGGLGGIFSGDLNLSMPRRSDYLLVKNYPGVYKSRGVKFIKKVTLVNNSSAYNLNGEFEIEVESNVSDKEISEEEYDVSLSPGEKKEFEFEFVKPKESTSIKYEFEFDDADEKTETEEGVEYILTPSPKPEPRINGAMIYGQRPGKPFLYRIAATGKRPIKFYAEGLPEGLSLDSEKGIISGSVSAEGKYNVVLSAENELGKADKTLEIIIGDKLALTPPMGWNSWNCWGLSVSAEKILQAAKAMNEKGLAEHGWTYVNIDDGWEIFGGSNLPKRKQNGEIITNNKFPDMKKLGDKIHSLGLKFGIYSTPGDLTCGGYTGSYKHEFRDARSFAEWGIDYLKYDLCGYRKIMNNANSPDELIPPYKLMNRALRSVNRDIVFSICEYGNGEVWKWGESAGGNLWRTTGDIWDDWLRMYRIGFSQSDIARYAGPGHWNDPDMLVIGQVGWGPKLHKSKLTPDEQYTHVSLWALLSAPLLLGSDLTALDDFTLNLITNDEVIEIDQDKLGSQAVRIIKADEIEVWKKALSDGNTAIGIFNVGAETAEYELNLTSAGISGAVVLRDLWRQKNLGKFKGNFKTVIPAHGVTLIKTIIR